MLSAFEAFFLAFGSPSSWLRIYASAADAEDAAGAMSEGASWAAFCTADPDFPCLYAAYRALRRVGWNIRDGVKFGVDFTLYEPAASPMAHATHSVLVLTPRAAGERSWPWLQRHVRLSHTVGKELLLCSVELAQDGRADDPAALTSSPSCLDALEVRTLGVRGWGAGREHAYLSQV